MIGRFSLSSWVDETEASTLGADGDGDGDGASEIGTSDLLTGVVTGVTVAETVVLL